MRIEDPLNIQSYIEFGAMRQPDVAPAGKARLWWDQATGLLKISVDGGGYGEVPNLLSGLLQHGSLLNASLSGPRLVTYSETVLFSGMVDGGGASGTKALSTTIPAGARVLFTLYTAITGFTGDVSAVAKLGDGTTADRYMTGTPNVFVTAAAGVDAGVVSGTAWHAGAKTPTLTVTSAADFTNVAAGSITVTIFYLAAS